MKDNMENLEKEYIFDEMRELISQVDQFKENTNFNFFAEGMKSMYLSLSNNN